MKSFCLIVMVAVSLLAAGAVSARAQTKIASVDLKKLFDGYYKTKLVEDVITKAQVNDRKLQAELGRAIDKEETDYKQLLDQASDPAISSDARDKLRQNAADKNDQISQDKVNYEKTVRRFQAELSDQSQQGKTKLLAEIQKAVGDKAKLGGYVLVVSSSINDTVLYASPDTDITASVLAQLNAGAPVDVSPPATSGLQLNVPANNP